MKATPLSIWSILLTLAHAAQAQGALHSTLRARPCGHTLASESIGGITVSVEPEGARNEYLQLTVFAVRTGQPDSVIAHEVRDPKPRVIVPGLYRLRVRSLGYQTVTDTLRVSRVRWWCVAARLAAAVPLREAP